MSNRRFFSGNNLEQAVLKAAQHYELEPDRLAYKVFEKKNGPAKPRRGVVIDVDPTAPEKPAGEAAQPKPDEAPSAPVVSEAASPAATTPVSDEPATVADLAVGLPSAEDSVEDEDYEYEPLEVPEFKSSSPDISSLPLAQGEAAEAAHHALATMLRLVGVQVEARILQAEERLEILLEGDNTEVFTEDEGEVLTAIQFLVPRIVRGITGQSTHCRVDSDGFHLDRERRLFELAWETAQRVDRTERTETLRPMPPDERRIVHLALADNDTVSTHSVGHGLYKRVAIRPA